MGWNDIGDSVCPIARALSVLGDRWTLLLIRELFVGTRRFDDFQAQTGMSPHLLSTRLKRLEDAGVVERRPYQERPPRHEYRLTPKGLALHPVILGLRAWGAEWSGLDPAGEPAMTVIHDACGQPVGAGDTCRHCGGAVTSRSVTASFGKGFAAERAARVAAFQAKLGKTPS